MLRGVPARSPAAMLVPASAGFMQSKATRSSRSSEASPGRAFLLALALAAIGCGAPVLTQDGQLVFTPGGQRGASVITAHGVEFLDRADIPQPVLRRSADEPWQPSTGFLIPRDGVWRKTSTAVPVQGRGLAVVLRSSDVLIPSWGGEILVRLDAIAPASAFPQTAASTRPLEDLVIVIDGPRADTTSLVTTALDDLGGADHVGLIDAGSAGAARPVLPLVPGSHRTLVGATVERLVAQAARGHYPLAARDLPGALAMARAWVSVAGAGDPTPRTRHVLVITDANGVSRGGEKLAAEVAAYASAGVRLSAVGADRLDPAALAPLGADVHASGSLTEREDAVIEMVPPPGAVVLDNVELTLASVPAPARVIEASGGQSALALDAHRLILGELYAGEARTEVLRVALPPWVPGEPMDITVTAHYLDVASGSQQSANAVLHCRYSADAEEIAEARHGDVIAYASALAMVRRLHRAFLGSEVDRLGGLRPMVQMQARSLFAMDGAGRDPALRAQAEILSALLGVVEE
ncbi:MAG: hypothetical protein ABI193_16315 [Minicystis sp.]